jgi:hypothetical protein
MSDPLSLGMGVGGKALQSAGGAKGGSGGAGLGNTASPEQAALAQYHLGQNLLNAREGYASTGTGASTMATQAAGGARNQFALEMSKYADQNLALSQQANSQLNQLAQQQGDQQAFGAGANSTSGQFGSTSGTLDSSSPG